MFLLRHLFKSIWRLIAAICIPSQSPLSSPSERASRRTALGGGRRHREMFSLRWNLAGSVEKRAFHRISSSCSLIWGLSRFVLCLVLLVLSVAGLPLKYAESRAPETSFADMIWTNLTPRLCPWTRATGCLRQTLGSGFCFLFFLAFGQLCQSVKQWNLTVALDVGFLVKVKKVTKLN